MHGAIRPLFLLHASDVLRGRLGRVQDGLFRLVPVPDWELLGDALHQGPGTALAVVDPYLEGTLAPALRRILDENPAATVIAALPIGPENAGDVRLLLRWGVAEVIALGREDTEPALARRIRSVQGRPLHRLIRRALPRGVPSRARTLLAAAAETVAAGGNAPELAAALGVNERTVPRWCERADLPPPRRLLAWLRLLLAADLLDHANRPVASVARACGYASEVSLKAALRQFVGAPPTELRRQGAFDAAARAFASELFERREAGRARGKPEKTWLT